MKNISEFINEVATTKQVKFGKIIEYSIGGTKISAPNFDSEYESISDGNDVDEHFKNKADEIAFIKQHKNDIIENGVSNSDEGELSGNNGDWYNEFTIDDVNFCILTDKAFFKKEYPYVAYANDDDITITDVIEKVVGCSVYAAEFKEKLKNMDYKSWLTIENRFSRMQPNLKVKPNLNISSYIAFLKGDGQTYCNYRDDDKCESKLDKKDGMYMNTCTTIYTSQYNVELHIKTKKPLFKNNKLIK